MTIATTPAALTQAAPAERVIRDEWIARAGIALLVLWLLVSIALPLWALLSKSFQRRGMARSSASPTMSATFRRRALFGSIFNSVWVAVVTTAIVIPAAFLYAFALTRSTMRFKGCSTRRAAAAVRAFALIGDFADLPVRQPGPAQGPAGRRLDLGPIGIVVAQVFYCFPHALIILVAALALADARLYEVAEALGTSKPRVFRTVTLPGAKYGLINAAFVVFTLVVTDFGIAKVIGGQFNVLATDAYKQVVGQQNFEMGAVVGMVLLMPAVLAFVIDRMVQRRQVALLSARAVPLEPKPNARATQRWSATAWWSAA